MKSNLRTTIFHHVLLTIITLLLLFLPLEMGTLFGSEGDWYSQHVGIAESLRQTMLETGSLLPQYMHLGGGSSIYDFAYYGLLRPDVLLSCLVPDIEIKYMIAGYAALGVVASTNLCYLWLERQKISKNFSLIGAILLGSSTCFYHAHYQIMFVNYMPFLLLALIGVDMLLKSKKMVLLVLSLFMIYIHSFYYAISCLFVTGIYAIHQILQQKEIQKKVREGKWKQLVKIISGPAGLFMLAIIISIGMSMVLLLPTGLDILSNEKDAGSFVTVSEKQVDWSLNGLLYSPYGCGMTMLTLYCLILSVVKKGKRFLSVMLLVCVAFPVISYVLNGFLYSRTKILIPFVPLFVFVAAGTLQALYQEKQKYYFVPLLICVIPFFESSWRPLLVADGVLLLIWVLLGRLGSFSKLVKNFSFGLVLSVPLLVSLAVNMSGSYLSSACSKLGISINGTYLKEDDSRQKHFTSEEISNFAKDSRYRFDILADSFVNCNLLADGKISKTAMYSSVTNTHYARFYYDVMRNPISFNNRVALVPNQNSCFSYFMGLKYILTDEENIPCGYEKVIQKGNYILAKNDEVLPVCYGTSELISKEAFDGLNFPDTLEALCSTAVVEEGTQAFTSHTKKEKVENIFAENGAERLLHPSGEKESFILPLSKSLSGKILVISFHVESLNGAEVIISINGMKNKLSSDSAPYPNNNHDFTYVLSAKDNLEQLEVEVSKGEYTVDNLELYTIACESLKHSGIVIPKKEEMVSVHECNVFKGEINMKKAGYFITSYPYRKGYQIRVDGKSVEPEEVNTAFVGFPIAEGSHRIEISYVAPGYKSGCIVSIISCLLFGLAAVLRLFVRRNLK